MRLIRAGESVELERGSAIVCVTAVGESTETVGTLESVLEHTGRSTPVLVAGATDRVEQLARELADQTADRTVIGLLTEPGNEALAVNAAIRASSLGDLALVAPGIRVASGWLEGLRAAATSDSTVASATPLSLGSAGVHLFGEGGVGDADGSVLGAPNGSDCQIAEAAERVAARTLNLHPRIAVIGAGCTYIRRSALELAGALDESLTRGDALADLAVRLTALGTLHVLADGVLVQGDYVRPAADMANVPVAQIGESVRETISNDEHGPLRRSISWARVTLDRLSVTIDGRALNATAGGTQTYILDLILALAGDRQAAIRVLVPPDLSDRATEVLASAPEVELFTYEQAIDHPRLTDVVHRPQQVFTLDDLTLLRLVGERVVIGQQDLIAYHNQSYHRDIDSWRDLPAHHAAWRSPGPIRRSSSPSTRVVMRWPRTCCRRGAHTL